MRQGRASPWVPQLHMGRSHVSAGVTCMHGLQQTPMRSGCAAETRRSVSWHVLWGMLAQAWRFCMHKCRPVRQCMTWRLGCWRCMFSWFVCATSAGLGWCYIFVQFCSGHPLISSRVIHTCGAGIIRSGTAWYGLLHDCADDTRIHHVVVTLSLRCQLRPSGHLGALCHSVCANSELSFVCLDLISSGARRSMWRPHPFFSLCAFTLRQPAVRRGSER